MCYAQIKFVWFIFARIASNICPKMSTFFIFGWANAPLPLTSSCAYASWQEKQKNVKKFDDDVMSANCDIIVIIPIYGQFGVIRKPDSGSIVCKTYIFININLLSCKNWTQSCKIFNTALRLLLWEQRYHFWHKMQIFR